MSFRLIALARCCTVLPRHLVNSKESEPVKKQNRELFYSRVPPHVFSRSHTEKNRQIGLLLTNALLLQKVRQAHYRAKTAHAL